jgi:hypothetical protein
VAYFKVFNPQSKRLCVKIIQNNWQNDCFIILVFSGLQTRRIVYSALFVSFFYQHLNYDISELSVSLVTL